MAEVKILIFAITSLRAASEGMLTTQGGERSEKIYETPP